MEEKSTNPIHENALRVALLSKKRSFEIFDYACAKFYFTESFHPDQWREVRKGVRGYDRTRIGTLWMQQPDGTFTDVYSRDLETKTFFADGLPVPKHGKRVVKGSARTHFRK